jgi:hypothetical protein
MVRSAQASSISLLIALSFGDPRSPRTMRCGEGTWRHLGDGTQVLRKTPVVLTSPDVGSVAVRCSPGPSRYAACTAAGTRNFVWSRKRWVSASAVARVSRSASHVGGVGALYLSSHTNASAATVEAELKREAVSPGTTGKGGAAIVLVQAGAY